MAIVEEPKVIAPSGPEVTPTQPPLRRLYFINERVEWSLTQYLWTGCTKVALRDAIMAHATELIRQIIRKQGLHTIYPGQEESAFGDLLQTAWVQIERTLYKYRARPHCRQCFNPDRPADSLLYQPSPKEYGIKTLEEVLGMHRGKKCPHCGTQLAATPLVESSQGYYGGSSTIIYRGMSKVFNMWCVAPNTSVFGCCGVTTIGEAIKKFAVNKDVRVHGLDGIKPIQAAKLRPMADTLAVTTELGYSIECSPEHQLLTLKADGSDMAEVGKLAVGDLLGIQYKQEIFGDIDDLSGIIPTRRGQWSPPLTMLPELANIIGLFIAEGSYSYGKLVIYNIDDDVIQRLLNNTLGLNFVSEPQYQRVSLCNVRFIEFLQALGFPEHTSAFDKYIPQRLLQLSRHNIIAMLSGLFDGDGHSSRYNGGVGYTTTSIVLRDQIRMLLLNLGIITKLSEDKRTTRKFTKKNGYQYTSKLRGSWQILLSTAASRIFYDLIGFGITRKQEKRLKLSPDREMVYGIKDRFRALYKKYGCGALGFNAIRYLLKGAKCTPVTSGSVVNWAAHYDDADYKAVVDRIDEITRDNDRIIWLPIKSIIKSRSELCEISVDSDTHTYIANGIISHNSQIARTVILAFIKKEGRDRKNSGSYVSHLDNKSRPLSGIMDRFLSEVRELWKYHEDNLKIIDAIAWIAEHDERPHDGIISKLVDKTGLSRATVTSFIQLTKLRSLELSDSNLNRGTDEHKADKRRGLVETDEEL